jgi:hypothetical protein
MFRDFNSIDQHALRGRVTASVPLRVAKILGLAAALTASALGDTWAAPFCPLGLRHPLPASERAQAPKAAPARKAETDLDERCRRETPKAMAEAHIYAGREPPSKLIIPATEVKDPSYVGWYRPECGWN